MKGRGAVARRRIAGDPQIAAPDSVRTQMARAQKTQVRGDVKAYGMRWVTVGSPSQPDVNIVLEPPAADPGISTADREAISDLLAKGLLRGLNFSTTDLDATFERVVATGAEVIQEPMDQAYGVRDLVTRESNRIFDDSSQTPAQKRAARSRPICSVGTASVCNHGAP